jgi:uncharacterized membrane protein YidH (DUF202 family)
VTSDRLFDEGAALERTQMAWVRTGLGLLATSALAVRLMLDEPTWLATGVAVVGGSGAVALLLVGQRRYRSVHADLWTSTGAVPGARTATAAVRAATVAVLVLSTLLAASMLQ